MRTKGLAAFVCWLMVTGTVVMGPLSTTPAGAQGCSAKPTGPIIVGPSDYVISGADQIAFTVFPDPAAVGCPDKYLLWVNPVEPNRTLMNDTDLENDDVKIRSRDCSRDCMLTTKNRTEVPIDMSGRDRAKVMFPEWLDPGIYRIRVRMQRGDEFAWSNDRDHLLTLPRYAELDHQARRAMLQHAQKKTGDDKHILEYLAASHRHFLRYEEAGGGDRLVEVFGEIAGARNVAVVVPGLGSTTKKAHDFDTDCGCVVSAGWMANAERLWLNAARVNDLDNTATIGYLGYDAPEVKNVGSSASASNGAGELRDDLRQWQIDPSKHLTLVGHSYGSTTLGYALGRGETADDAVLVGSPGAGVHAMAAGSCDWSFDNMCCPGTTGISCFAGVDDGHTWTAVFDQDPVPKVTGDMTLGTRPDRDSFGAIEYHTEPPQCSDWGRGYSVANSKCHSHYFSWGYTALKNLTAIVLGRYSEVSLVGKNPKVPRDLSIERSRAPWPEGTRPLVPPVDEPGPDDPIDEYRDVAEALRLVLDSYADPVPAPVGSGCTVEGDELSDGEYFGFVQSSGTALSFEPVCVWTQSRVDAAGLDEFPGDNGLVYASSGDMNLPVGNDFVFWRMEAGDGVPTVPCTGLEPRSVWSVSAPDRPSRLPLCRSSVINGIRFAVLMVRDGHVVEAVEVWTS